MFIRDFAKRYFIPVLLILSSCNLTGAKRHPSNLSAEVQSMAMEESAAFTEVVKNKRAQSKKALSARSEFESYVASLMIGDSKQVCPRPIVGRDGVIIFDGDQRQDLCVDHKIVLLFSVQAILHTLTPVYSAHEVHGGHFAGYLNNRKDLGTDIKWYYFGDGNKSNEIAFVGKFIIPEKSLYIDPNIKIVLWADYNSWAPVSMKTVFGEAVTLYDVLIWAVNSFSGRRVNEVDDSISLIINARESLPMFKINTREYFHSKKIRYITSIYPFAENFGHITYNMSGYFDTQFDNIN
jgi:hypothetical protein